jgi:hypothetical protein
MKVYLNLLTAAVIVYYIAFSNFHFTLFPPNILIKIFLSKAASRLAMPSFSVQDSLPNDTAGLMYVLKIFIFSALSTYWIFSRGRSA